MMYTDGGNIFSVLTKDNLINKVSNGKRQVYVEGRVNNKCVIDVPEHSTVKDVIELAGGLVNKGEFKGAHLGSPFGIFITEEDLEKEIDFDVFQGGTRTIYILSSEDCIIQYALHYVETLVDKIQSTQYIEKYRIVEETVKHMWNSLDKISKGKSSMRGIYMLRDYSEKVEKTLNLKFNIMGKLIEHYYEEIEDHIEEDKCKTMQCNNLIKLNITSKCIGCGACKRVCPVDCINGEKKQKHKIDYNKCTHCGRCISACPLDAITSGDNTQKFMRDLLNTNKIIVTQMAPAVRVAIGEAFGFEPGVNVEKKLAAGLRKLGVDYVFDTNWAADLTIMEEAAELQQRLEKYFAGDENVKLPMLTSCCPAWVKFIEQNYADMLDIPSTAKSPMQMFATVVKDIWAREQGIKRVGITSVAIMPCIAKKYEASRVEFSRGTDFDVDYVITTKELIKIFKDENIDLKELEDEEIDEMLGEYTGAGAIFGRTGGVIEAALRTTLENMTGKRIENVEFESLRGWDGFRTCEVEVGDIKLRVGVAHGLEEAGKMLDKIRDGEEFFHAIEIMACPGGCVGGGGQPKLKKNKDEILRLRGEGLNEIDRSKSLRVSKDNKAVQAIYENYLGHPMSHKAHELLHTRYFVKRKK